MLARTRPVKVFVMFVETRGTGMDYPKCTPALGRST